MDTAMLDADKHNLSQLSYPKQQKTPAANPRRITHAALVNIHIRASGISIWWKELPQQQGISLYAIL